MKIFGLETTGSFTGDISGSITSTGSFGDGRFVKRVGIGNTSPAADLHITQGGTTGADGIRLTNGENFQVMAGIIGQTNGGFSISKFSFTPDSTSSNLISSHTTF